MFTVSFLGDGLASRRARLRRGLFHHDCGDYSTGHIIMDFFGEKNEKLKYLKKLHSTLKKVFSAC